MAKHSDTRLKKYNLWWYLFRMKRYINLDEVESRISKTAFIKGEMFNAIDQVGEKASLVIEGTIKDCNNIDHNIKFSHIQLLEIPISKYFLIKLFLRRIPILVDQVYIDDVPLIDKWYKKLNYPQNFVRKKWTN